MTDAELVKLAERERIARIMAKAMYNGATFDECNEMEREAWLIGADAVIAAQQDGADAAELVKLADFAETLRKYWSFDDRQMHTHSWHSREDFIEKVLPGLLAAKQRPIWVQQADGSYKEGWEPTAQQDGGREAGLTPTVRFTSEAGRDAYAKRLSDLARHMLSSFDQGAHHTITVNDQMINDVRAAAGIIKLCQIQPNDTHEQ